MKSAVKADQTYFLVTFELEPASRTSDISTIATRLTLCTYTHLRHSAHEICPLARFNSSSRMRTARNSTLVTSFGSSSPARSRARGAAWRPVGGMVPVLVLVLAVSLCSDSRLIILAYWYIRANGRLDRTELRRCTMKMDALGHKGCAAEMD